MLHLVESQITVEITVSRNPSVGCFVDEHVQGVENAQVYDAVLIVAENLPVGVTACCH